MIVDGINNRDQHPPLVRPTWDQIGCMWPLNQNEFDTPALDQTNKRERCWSPLSFRCKSRPAPHRLPLPPWCSPPHPGLRLRGCSPWPPAPRSSGSWPLWTTRWASPGGPATHSVSWKVCHYLLWHVHDMWHGPGEKSHGKLEEYENIFRCRRIVCRTGSLWPIILLHFIKSLSVLKMSLKSNQ